MDVRPGRRRRRRRARPPRHGDLGLAGSVEYSAGLWWVANRSAKRPLLIESATGHAPRRLGSGHRHVVNVSPLAVLVPGAIFTHRIEVLLPDEVLAAFRVDAPAPSGKITLGVLVPPERDRHALLARFTTTVTDAAGQTDSRSDPISVQPNGRVRAWGLNALGQLGDGTTAMRTTPTQVSGLGAASDVIVIAGGGYTTMALKSDGTVLAWGAQPGRTAGRWHDHEQEHPGTRQRARPGKWRRSHRDRAFTCGGAENRRRPTGLGVQREWRAWRRERHEQECPGADQRARPGKRRQGNRRGVPPCCGPQGGWHRSRPEEQLPRRAGRWQHDGRLRDHSGTGQRARGGSGVTAVAAGSEQTFALGSDS